jgi:WD40 repeat protein
MNWIWPNPQRGLVAFESLIGLELAKIDSLATRTLIQNTGDVYSLCWSPDGSRIVVGTYAGYLKVIDPDHGSVLMTIDTVLSGKRRGPVRAVEFSQDGNTLLVATRNRVLAYCTE